MNFQLMPDEKIQAIFESIEQIRKEVTVIQKNPKEVFFDSQQLMEVLNISKSTLQKLRNNGLIGFSQVHGKFFYSQSDINDMIKKNYIPASK